MKQWKIGIFGAGRGCDIARNFKLLGCEIVAICDFHPARLRSALEELGDGVASYTDFKDFIEHDMDAVVLANYFYEHAPYAIECFKRGIHVYSECISNGTMAEGVALARAAENTTSIYMLGENYPQMSFNREMKRVVDTGSLGRILYAEGEYNHPGSPDDLWFAKTYCYFPEHWRNFNPATYYITHSIGPVMRATGATPKRVTAFAAFAPVEGAHPVANYVGDRTAIITTQNDDGSIFRVTGCSEFGAYHNAYRVCGTEGQIENLRGTDGKIMLRYNGWSKPEGAEEVNCYDPDWNDPDVDKIEQSGHGGSDYITARMFVEAMEEGRQPEFPFNLHAAIAMSSVAILAHRSVLAGGQPFDIPDFTKEEDRVKYENDWLSPAYLADGTPPTLPASSVPGFAPTDEQVALFRKLVMEEE